MLYMATGKLAHLGCKFVSSKVVLSFWSCRDYLQLQYDRTTLLLTNLQPK